MPILNQNLPLAQSERSSKRPLETHLILLENNTEGGVAGGWCDEYLQDPEQKISYFLCKLCLNLISSTPAPNFCPWLYFYVNQEKGALGKEGKFYFPNVYLNCPCMEKKFLLSYKVLIMQMMVQQKKVKEVMRKVFMSTFLWIVRLVNYMLKTSLAFQRYSIYLIKF